MRVQSLEYPHGAHQSEDDTANKSNKSHTCIVDPKIYQSAHISDSLTPELAALVLAEIPGWCCFNSRTTECLHATN